MDLNRYYQNEEMLTLFNEWAAAYPGLLEVRQLGESHEKRPIWLLVITAKNTGADTDKPAVWIDANIHATELTGSTTVMAIAERLLSGYGSDPKITHLLDYSVYYIAPRVNPDGAALALAKVPRAVRSGVRYYPWEEKVPGLHDEDVDGDGRILQMRLQDPNGDWKISSLDARLMEKRLPDEFGGVYYRILPEGNLLDFDGYTITTAPPPEGLDFNRNFPFEWRTEGEQHGAGPYPASEPEIRAMVDFVARHRNINIAIAYHTFSRVILRCYSTKPDDDMETLDLWIYKDMGKIGTQITGYRSVSTYHDFTYFPKQVTTGAFDDYMYDHFGAFAFTVELWDLPTEAGIENRKFIEWMRDHPHEQDLQILKWIEEHAPQGYVDWYAFDHPQLGKVELGGWDHMYTWINPPLAFLEAEVQRNIAFPLTLGHLLPRLSIFLLELKPLGEDIYHLNLVVDNNGYLPTYTSQQGKKRKATRPVRAELVLPEDVVLLDGRPKVELGYLEGRSAKVDVNQVFAEGDTDQRARAEWTLRAPKGAEFTVRVLSERAGSLTKKITVP